MSSAISQAPAIGYPGILDQMQVFQHRYRVLQPGVNTGALRKFGLTLRSNLDGRGKGAAGYLIQTDKTLFEDFEEEIANLVARQLLRSCALTDKEPVPKGIGSGTVIHSTSPALSTFTATGGSAEHAMLWT